MAYGAKRKIIISRLKNKIDDLAASISDPVIAGLVRKHSIITGGSIASMLIGDPVNDYDIYFRSEMVAKSVAEYYVNAFIKANSPSPEPIVLSQTIKNIRGVMEPRVVVSVPSNGVSSEGGKIDLDNESDPLEDTGAIYRPVFLSPNAITLSGDVQLIVRFFGEADKIHESFDFVHALSFYDSGDGRLELPARTLECLLSRTLVYQGSLYPVCSMFRMKKFMERGWRINVGEQLKIAWQISELDLHDFDIIREQLIGVDASYLSSLVDALKDVQSEKMNSTYVGAVIDRIFG